MAGLLIAIFLGWAGGYRFYKKNIWLGILYLLTFGLLGIGWLVDIYLALRELMNLNAPVKSIEQVKGAFAECRKDPHIKRKTIIEGLNVGDDLALEISYFETKPFYLVVDVKTNLDIGALPKETSRAILDNCPNAKLSATLVKKDIDYPEIELIIKR